MTIDRPTAPRLRQRYAGRFQIQLRVVILLSGLAMIGAVRGAAGEAQPALDVAVICLAGVCALFPDSHLGLVVVVLAGVDWMIAVDDETTPWAVSAAAALALFHTSLAMASVAPFRASFSTVTVRKWIGRAATAAVMALLMWLAVAGIGLLDLGRSPVLVGLALLVLAVAGIWSRHGGFRKDSELDAPTSSRWMSSRSTSR